MDSSKQGPDPSPEARAEQERAERRRRQLAALGELAPSTTRDESAEGWGEREASSRDDELRRDVPPHHGG